MRGKKNFITQTLVALLITTTLSASTLAQTTQTTSDSAQILLKAEAVHDEAIGYTGERTPLYLAFASLWQQGVSARAEVVQLLKDGTPAGRLYGLILLQHIDSEQAARVGETMKKASESVRLIQGCLVFVHPLSELTSRLLHGEVIIVTPTSKKPNRASRGAL